MKTADWKTYAAIKRLMEKYGMLFLPSADYEGFNRELLEILGL